MAVRPRVRELSSRGSEPSSSDARAGESGGACRDESHARENVTESDEKGRQGKVFIGEPRNKATSSYVTPSPSGVSGPGALRESDTSASRLFLNYPRSLRNLALRARSFARARAERGETRTSTMQRPTKDELLSIARGFWTRMRIRFKWFTIRGFRRFNMDDISAFFTLGGLGTAIWIIVCTTTFVSVIFAALNMLHLEQWITRQLTDYFSRQTGFTVICGSAVVPKWKEGRISFKDVVIARHPEPMNTEQLRQRQVRGDIGRDVRFKSTDAPEATIPAFDTGKHLVQPLAESDTSAAGDESLNYSMFELRVDSIDVQLSLRRWLDGRGLIHKAEIRGVRGIIGTSFCSTYTDRRHVHWNSSEPYNPRAARRQPGANDVDLDYFTIDDFLVTVYQPGDFRPFNASIFHARIPRLRMQWLFYDLLNAESMTGQIDGCLFSLHKPQSVYHTTREMYDQNNERFRNWSRLRVDGVNIDHVQKLAGLSGPLMWIYAGRFDLVADIKFPRQYGEDVDINAILSEILDNLNSALSSDRTEARDERLIPGQPELSEPVIVAPVTAVGPVAERARQQQVEQDTEARMHEGSHGAGDASGTSALLRMERGAAIPSSVVIELEVRFKDIKASMPIFTRELSYSTYALARPIIAFMNANKTLIPVHCRIVMDLSEFDGSLDLAQTGLPPLVSDKIWEALANHVASQQANSQRVRNVSLWSLDIMLRSMLRFARSMRDTIARTPSPEVPAT